MALDVLKRLHLTKLKQGSYFDSGPFKLKELDHDQQLDAKTVEMVRPKCQVCLLGACVLAKARVLDDVTKGEAFHYLGGDRYEFYLDHNSQLYGVFSGKQVDLMERVFERRQIDLNEPISNYANKFKSDRALVKAVMTNLIENGGEFVLPTE